MSERSDQAARGGLSSGRLLARNTVLSFLGQATILLMAFLAVPLLIDGLGTARFGVLTLAWVVFSYASLLDLGLGRALTKLTAEKLGAGREEDVPVLFWTGFVVMSVVGALLGLLVALASPWVVADVLNIPESLRDETLNGFLLLAAGVPFVVSSAGVKGTLEAYQRFDLINGLAVPIALVTYFGPVVVLQYTSDLAAVVSIVVAGRLITWAAYLLLALRSIPALRQGFVVSRVPLPALFGVGKWITVTNLVYPLMVTLDRFLIGAMISVTAVAYYAAPYEVVTKLWIVPFALGSVLFPAFALNLAAASGRASELFGRGIRIVFVVLFPLVLMIVTFAYEGLDQWLGQDFAENSGTVAQWLAVGVLIHSLTLIASALVQSARPDLYAKLALLELPLYVVALWLCVASYGIEGAAVAWTVRVVLDGAALLAMIRRLLPASIPMLRRMALPGGIALVTLLVATQLEGLSVKVAFIALSLPTFSVIAWLAVLDHAERLLVRKCLLGTRSE